MNNPNSSEQLIVVHPITQRMFCYDKNSLTHTFIVSTGRNGLGEKNGSGCTPRGWHKVYSVIGLECEENSVFVGRKWTGEIYSEELALEYPERDWILTRVIQIKGVEPGRNLGGNVDSLERYIYFHGVPDALALGVPGSRGCIRLSNKDIITFADWVKINSDIYI